MSSEHKLHGYDSKQVERAVDALLAFLQKKKSKDVLEGEEGQHINLQFGMMKIQPTKNNRMIKVPMPHRVLIDEDVCLFVKDLNKHDKDHEATERHYKELLQKQGITNITEIISMKRLKLEYQPYESKRNLCGLYDVMLADERILRLLPGFLGKFLFKSKKYPRQVDLTKKDLKTHIDKVLDYSVCTIGGKGSSCQVKVSTTEMSKAETMANVNAAITRLCEEFPGGAGNIKSIHIKTNDSPSLPIYISLKNPTAVKLPQEKRKKTKQVAEDVTPIEGGLKVINVGNADFKLVKERKKKGKKAAAGGGAVAAAGEAKENGVATEKRKGKRKASESLEELEKAPTPVPVQAAVVGSAKKGKRKASESEAEEVTPVKKGKRKVSETVVEATTPVPKKKKNEGTPKGVKSLTSPIAVAAKPTPKSLKKTPKAQSGPATPKAEVITPKTGKKNTPKSEKKTPKAVQKELNTPKSTPKSTPKAAKKDTPKSGKKSPRVKTMTPKA